MRELGSRVASQGFSVVVAIIVDFGRSRRSFAVEGALYKVTGLEGGGEKVSLRALQEDEGRIELALVLIR